MPSLTWTSSSLSILAHPRPQGRHRLAGLSIALLLLPMVALGAPAPGKSKLPSITIEAAKEHALRLEVDQFVLSVLAQPLEGSLLRWNAPVCPLVAGLPKSAGEFLLEHISKAALDSGAPLGARVCHPNLYVVATDYPDRLLKKWWARDRYMYSTGSHGMPPIRRFIHSRRPVRVWYNTVHGCRGSAPVPAAAATAFGRAGFAPPICGHDLAGGSPRLLHGILRSITSAIVAVDLRQMKKATLQQLADYIALVSLADVRLDADPIAAPSILRLFAGHATPPQGLTRWDRALLYALYNTSQGDRLQVPEIEITMVGRIGP